MNEAALALFVGEFVGCVVFCILFGRKWRKWLHTRMGPNLFAMMFVLAVLQAVGVLRLIVPVAWLDQHAIEVRFWSFLTLFIVVWWRVILLARIQHEDAVEERRILDADRAHRDAARAHQDATGAHEDALQAHGNAQRAHEDGLPERDGDNTDPEWDLVR